MSFFIHTDDNRKYTNPSPQLPLLYGNMQLLKSRNHIVTPQPQFLLKPHKHRLLLLFHYLRQGGMRCREITAGERKAPLLQRKTSS
ncbi:hypothetical protein Y032_0568g58 [Ancylostoma ceylanicum]|uniref:Uncharacterized protein n=1 Tax=Ancylostoma ceylanicum TaxID=53326 RepID=A0A016WR23_9BILA|nr:hypothetical protein Y032_0568g58 [Ancylostoma ceylanicum]